MVWREQWEVQKILQTSSLKMPWKMLVVFLYHLCSWVTSIMIYIHWIFLGLCRNEVSCRCNRNTKCYTDVVCHSHVKVLPAQTAILHPDLHKLLLAIGVDKSHLFDTHDPVIFTLQMPQSKFSSNHSFSWILGAITSRIWWSCSDWRWSFRATSSTN